MKCQECETARHPLLHEDPRDPPLDTSPCLCPECCIAALDEVIFDMDGERTLLQQKRDGLQQIIDLRSTR